MYQKCRKDAFCVIEKRVRRQTEKGSCSVFGRCKRAFLVKWRSSRKRMRTESWWASGAR